MPTTDMTSTNEESSLRVLMVSGGVGGGVGGGVAGMSAANALTPRWRG